MAMNADNIAAHEIIGMHAVVIDAPNQSMIGLGGLVTYETRSMIDVSPPHDGLHFGGGSGMTVAEWPRHANPRVTRRIPKKNAVLRVWRSTAGGKKTGRPYVINCSTMLKRPHERKSRRSGAQ